MKTRTKSLVTGMVLACALGGAAARGQTVIYVDKDAPGPTHDGSSWNDAYLDLQLALSSANPLDDIRVAQGTYYPGTVRSDSFGLVDQVDVLGGYAGFGEPDPDARDPEGNPTILSGELGLPGNNDNSLHVVTLAVGGTAVLDGFTISDGNANGLSDLEGGGLYTVNSYLTVRDCVFKNNAAESGAGLYGGGLVGELVLVDCTFTDNVAVLEGGGMYAADYSLNLSGCKFRGNTAGWSGGGVHYFTSGQAPTGLKPTFTRCTFEDNEANPNGSFFGSGGGGIFFGGTVELLAKLTLCTFERNEAARGGGIDVTTGSAVLFHCKFIQNKANGGGSHPGDGGGVWFRTHRPQGAPTTGVARFVNCLFDDNTAQNNGGGFYVTYAFGVPTTPNIENCTFGNNTAVGVGGGIYYEEDRPALSNCILWGNTDGDQDPDATDESAQIHGALSPTYEATVTYSSVQGLETWLGMGNIALDPLFVGPNDLRLRVESPCIDAGNNLLVPFDVLDIDEDEVLNERIPWDMIEFPRFFDNPSSDNNGVDDLPLYPDMVDMGVYEYGLCSSEPELNCCDANNFVDCDLNGRMDACEIQEMAALDQDVDGNLDSCQPCIVHGATDVSFSSHAFGGYIDPRSESSDGVALDRGISALTIVFCEAVGDAVGNVLDPTDFVLTVTGGIAPTITGVTTSDNITFVLTLSGVIPVQEWTTIEANVFSLADPSIAILDLGNQGPTSDEPDRIDVGFLPCDIDQNGLCNPLDLFRFNQYVNDVVSPSQGVVDDYTDIDRSGTTTPIDVFRLRQLINGVSPATKAWAGESLTGRP
jgi:Chlamydia polymorphic membrane protein (Chlamydia_PMP) repeat